MTAEHDESGKRGDVANADVIATQSCDCGEYSGVIYHENMYTSLPQMSAL